MSKPHINAKTMAMIYKTRDAIEGIEKGAGKKFEVCVKDCFGFRCNISNLTELTKHAVLDCVWWDETKEGFTYWENIWEELRGLE